MREILFRGKRIDNGKWTEGFLVVGTNYLNRGESYILPCISDISCSYGDNGNRMRIGCFIKVDPSTVGQYTGLTDKNGKKIFEGDIVQFRTRSSTFNPLYVRWYEETAQFIVTETNCVRSYPMDRSWEYEILGNFYDNIDILREAANE